MRPLLAVTAQSRNLGQIQVKLLDEPVDGVARLVRENLDQVIAGEISCGLFGVGEARR